MKNVRKVLLCFVVSRHLNQSTGKIKSRKLTTPAGYARPSNFSWLITANDGFIVTLSLSSLKILNNDVITVYDGANAKASVLAIYSILSGNQTDSFLVSTMNVVYILLTYDTSSNDHSEFVFNYASQAKPTGGYIYTSCRLIR